MEDLNHRQRVVVLHALRPTSRQTTTDHLLSFREHLPYADVQYLHFSQPLPAQLTDVEVDLLIINYDFLNYRFTALWPYIKNRHLEIARKAKKTVAIAQDDFWANKHLDDWCMHWKVDRILAAIDSDLDILYPRSVRTKEIKTALTGYVRTSASAPSAPIVQRPIDLGQRVREMPPHLGRLAQAKARQAVAMAEAATNAGYIVDVSTHVEDSFLGEDWMRFLRRCKFTVGMKGGASLNDPRGRIHTKVQAYKMRFPHASFDDIEQHCFPGKDGKHEFTAISPRLFEAAAAGACQILQRDDYLGVLEPWRDYIPLERDFSNMSDVLAAMKDLEQAQEIADSAYSSLVVSGMFDYKQLVHDATNNLLTPSSCSDSVVQWNSFCNFLSASAHAQLNVSADLHDASLHLINEILLRMSSRQVEHLEAHLASDSVDTWIEQEKISRPEAVAISTVMRELKRNNCVDWFILMMRNSRADSNSLRSVWAWRTL